MQIRIIKLKIQQNVLCPVVIDIIISLYHKFIRREKYIIKRR